MNKPAKRGPDSLFLPDFCGIRTVFIVVIIGQLLAFVITLVGAASLSDVFGNLALVSLLVQWIALGSAALLCLSRPLLARFSEPAAAAGAYLLILMVTYALSETAWWFVLRAGEVMTGTRVEFLLRNLAISAIVSALALRYFYVQYHWQRRIESESQARIQALQSRIRPHFFFNCMNTIASLTRTRPQEAELAVLDLADLFRASLADARDLVPLADELALCRQYLNIESLRLGARLQVEWEIDALPDDAHLPALTLQPLLENAIYHGIELRADGGVISVHGESTPALLTITIDNPLPADGAPSSGNQVAQDNVRQRLAAHFGEAGQVNIEADEQRYRVVLSMPYRTSAST